MELGMIGLGRMGANMTQRLLSGGHRVVGFDFKPEARKRVEQYGAESVAALDALAAKLAAPRTLWMMVPSGEATEATVNALLPLLAAGDTVIDGGNSNYKDTQRRARHFADRKVNYVDCGTSGGVWGLAEGYSMMIGGEESVVERLRPIFETLAPAPNRGWGRVGPSGAGHFTKMIHNGIEYGLMQAYAEGFSIMQHKTEFGLDLHQVAEIWRNGSVVRSWLLDLTAIALKENPDSGWHRTVCSRFRRRTMDRGRSDRSERSGPGDHACADCAPRVARFGFVRSEDAVGDAKSVWRARNQEAMSTKR